MEKQFKRQLLIKRGHSLFGFDVNTGVLKQIPLGQKTIEKVPLPSIPKDGNRYYVSPSVQEVAHSQAELDENMLYVTALNIKNAQKAVNKLIGKELDWQKL